MLALHMDASKSESRPYAYVFVEGNGIVIRGSGPFGTRLMMAMSSGWENIQAEERITRGRSTWSIRLSGDKRLSKQNFARKGLLKRLGVLVFAGSGWAVAGLAGGAGLWAAAGGIGLIGAAGWLIWRQP